MMWELTFTCRKCQRPFQAKSWKSVDVVEDPKLRKLLMSDKFNLNLCPHCGHPALIHGPFILWEDYFIALVLSQPFKAQDAMGLIKLLLTETKPNREDAPTEVLVFATLEKLQKALADPKLTRLRVPLEQVIHRDWSSVKLPLQEIADALLQYDMPERAFLIYRQVIAEFPELYFHQDIRETLELLAYAAGPRVAPEQIDRKTALEQLQEIDEKLTPISPQIPSFFPYQVFYCPIDETGETGKGQQEGDEHVVTSIDPFIKTDPLAKDEQVRGLLLVSAFSSLVLQWLPSPQPDILRFNTIAKARMNYLWFELNPQTRYEIELWFEATTGSRITED